MATLKHRRGDLFEAIKTEVLTLPQGDPKTPFIVVPHVVNNKGLWGAGFVLEVSKFCPLAEEDYRAWMRSVETSKSMSRRLLGSAKYTIDTEGEERYAILHMCAQDDVGGVKPLRYAALGKCMYAVDDGLFQLMRKRIQIWCPKFGAGLAGGNWLLIEEMVRETWVEQLGYDVTVFTR